MLTVANFPDPQDPTNPIPVAIVRISGLSINFDSGYGELRLSAFRSNAAANDPAARPAADLTISLGQVFPAGKFPSIVEALADPDFANSWAILRGKLYGWAKTHPLLVNAT